MRNERNERNEKGQFEKGMTPWNKGKTYKFENHINETSFKKAEKHPRYKPIGSERIERDGYVVVKVADRKWLPKHRHLWEQANGPVPKGHVVIFANGNKRDFSIDNLICVSRRQLAVINHQKLITEDTELTKTAVILSEIHLKMLDKGNERR